jgi:hypothetical protein
MTWHQFCLIKPPTTPIPSPTIHPPTVTSLTYQLPKPEIPSANKPRRRGVILTEAGWQKLVQAEVVYNHYGERYTFEQLSDRAMLDPRTVCRMIEREIGVDKRTLTTFFGAFNLKLEKTDYITLAIHKRDNQPRARKTSPGQVPPFLPNPEAEMAQIKQQIISNCHHLAALLGIDHSSQTTFLIKFSAQAQAELEVRLQQQYNLHLVP